MVTLEETTTIVLQAIQEQAVLPLIDRAIVEAIAEHLWEHDAVCDRNPYTIPSAIQDQVIWHLYQFIQAHTTPVRIGA